MKMHDVVIVGASVAGASTAIHLSRAGIRVLLIDRETFPRSKVCGEGIFPKGVDELAALGVLEGLVDRARVLKSLCFEMNAEICEAPLSPSGRPGLGVQRRILDQVLLEQATRAGAEIRLGVRAEGLIRDADGRFAGISTGRGEAKARAIVGADGLGSMLRRRAGLDVWRKAARYGVSAHLSLDEWGDTISVQFRTDHELYLTPVGKNLTNVALLLSAERARRMSGDLKGAFERYVGGKPGLTRLAFVDAPRMMGPFPVESRRLFQGNLVLVGDAAGFYDPITGEGISTALTSASLAAKALEGFLAHGTPEPFERYEREARRIARPSRLMAKLILALEKRPFLAKRAIRNLGRRPEVFSRLIGVNGGEVSFRELRPRDVVALTTGR
jgi:geranylgeranyl reductase family protein